jgi:hypothetical protein
VYGICCGLEDPAGTTDRFSKSSRLALGLTQPPLQWVPGTLSLCVKQSVREADRPLVSSAEVKEWSCTSTPPVCLHGTYRGNLPCNPYFCSVSPLSPWLGKSWRCGGLQSWRMLGMQSGRDVLPTLVLADKTLTPNELSCSNLLHRKCLIYVTSVIYLLSTTASRTIRKQEVFAISFK